MIPNYERLITALTSHDVEFVVIGAIALVLHGSSRVTRDLDICYSRDRPNLTRLASALKPLAPTLRGAPADLPFVLDERTLASGLNFTLTCAAGDIDLLAEITGLGAFPVVARLSERMRLYEQDVRVLSLDGLERAKRATGRLKDLADLAEILEIRRRTPREQRRTPGRCACPTGAARAAARPSPRTRHEKGLQTPGRPAPAHE